MIYGLSRAVTEGPCIKTTDTFTVDKSPLPTTLLTSGNPIAPNLCAGIHNLLIQILDREGLCSENGSVGKVQYQPLSGSGLGNA